MRRRKMEIKNVVRFVLCNGALDGEDLPDTWEQVFETYEEAEKEALTREIPGTENPYVTIKKIFEPRIKKK